MNIIICGEICSGKDELASLLPGVKLAFAEDFKNICKLLRIGNVGRATELMSEYFGIHTPSNLKEKLMEFSRYPTELGKDRRLYQDIGMWSRSVYPNVWTNALKSKIKSNAVVITDCRFHNELDAFPEFYSVYVDASEEVRRERMIKRDGEIKEDSLSNPAESEVMSLKERCKYVIVNNGSLQELQLEVNILLAWINFDLTN